MSVREMIYRKDIRRQLHCPGEGGYQAGVRSVRICHLSITNAELRIGGLTGFGIRTLGDLMSGTCAAAAYCAVYSQMGQVRTGQRTCSQWSGMVMVNSRASYGRRVGSAVGTLRKWSSCSDLDLNHSHLALYRNTTHC